MYCRSQNDNNKRPIYIWLQGTNGNQILYSYYLLVVTCITFLGGGPGSDDEDMAIHGKRFTMCMFLSMETVSFLERVMLVDVSWLKYHPI